MNPMKNWQRGHWSITIFCLFLNPCIQMKKTFGKDKTKCNMKHGVCTGLKLNLLIMTSVTCGLITLLTAAEESNIYKPIIFARMSVAYMSIDWECWRINYMQARDFDSTTIVSELASFPGEYRRTPSRQPKAKPVAGINALFESYGFSGRCCSLLWQVTIGIQSSLNMWTRATVPTTYASCQNVPLSDFAPALTTDNRPMYKRWVMSVLGLYHIKKAYTYTSLHAPSLR